MAHVRFPSLPAVRELIALYGLSARAHLSQNFIMNLELTDRIARAARVAGKAVIEVGPGPGSLTRSLLACGSRRVVTVEKDRRFEPALRALARHPAADGRLVPVIGDMLLVDEARLCAEEAQAAPCAWDIAPDDTDVRIVGNLPFNVGTLLVIKWLRQLHERSGVFAAHGRAPLVLLLQKEVVERMQAPPGVRDYGRLSVMCQQSCDVRTLLTVRGETFVPAAKVDAQLVQLLPKREAALPAGVPIDILERVCGALFGRRRKKVSSALRALGVVGEQLAVQFASELDKRPEQMAVDTWCRLASALYTLQPTATSLMR